MLNLGNYFENANNIIPGDDNVNKKNYNKKIKNSLFNNIVSGQLWLGNYKAALDPVFIKENNISVIINCSVDIPFIFDLIDPHEYGISKLETYRIPVYDSLLEHDIYIMEQYLHKVLPFIFKKLLKEKKNVFIGCHAGKQRSACVMAAVLYVLIDNDLMSFHDKIDYKDKGKLMKKVIEYIRLKRPCAFSWGLRVNFKESLQRFFNIKF